MVKVGDMKHEVYEKRKLKKKRKVMKEKGDGSKSGGWSATYRGGG